MSIPRRIKDIKDSRILLWHGGPAGRKRGEFLLPPSVTKTESTSDLVPNDVHRRDRVYLTTRYRAALIFAASHRKGVVYLCEPVGYLENDPDCDTPNLSFSCERAIVTKIIKPKPWEVEMARQSLLGGATE